jgi:hypothetical protein
MSDKPGSKIVAGCISGCLVFCAIIGLIASFCLILSVISNTYPWLDESCEYVSMFTEIHTLGSRLFLLAMGFPTGSAGLYTIVTISNGSSLTWHKRLVIFISAVAGVVLAVLLASDFFLNCKAVVEL